MIMRGIWLLGLMASVACSSGGTTPTDGGADDSASSSDTSLSQDAPTDSSSDATTDAASGYPTGPYGTKVGSVIANMTWIGYVDDAADALATTKPYVTYSLDDARKSGKHYAMLNLAETFCPGCQKSAGELATGGASVVNAGGVVIEVLETTGFTSQASKTDLTSWVNKYQLPITSVKDQDGSGTPTLTALGQREQAYIIDLTTMKIIQIIPGDITGAGATSGGKAMTAMHTLLGK
jgi:hypothetical protein